MRDNYYVPIGFCLWAKSPQLLFCKGIGSCLALAFYDCEKKNGCLAHVLLPYGNNSDNPFYYVNLTISEVVKKLQNRVKLGKIVAKMAGGAKLFPLSEKSVGERNIESARFWLKHYQIPLVGEDVGGGEGRNVIFDLESGEMTITTLRRGSYSI